VLHSFSLSAFRRARGVHSKVANFGANFIGSPPFWTDGTEAHKIPLMCVDAVESKYQLMNKCKLLFDLVVYQQQHSNIVSGYIPVRMAKFERNFTKHNFIFDAEYVQT
jgi:hypothetical protein